MPYSGKGAWASPAAALPCPLASAYERTALMKDTPTSGPTSASITHHERELINSRHSFLRSHLQALGEGKEDLLEIRRQVMAGALTRNPRERVKGAFGDNTAAAQQHEAITNLRGIGDLVNRQEERAVWRKVLAQCGSRLAALTKVKALERLLDQNDPPPAPHPPPPTRCPP